MSKFMDEVKEVVHKVEDTLLHHDEEEQTVSNKKTVYMNFVNEKLGVTEDYPIWKVTKEVLGHLEAEDLRSEFVGLFNDSKALAKAFLNRVFDFRKHYAKKEDGLVYFYDKTVAYPTATLVNDMEYALQVDHDGDE